MSTYAPRHHLSMIAPIVIVHTALLALVVMSNTGLASARHGDATVAVFDVSMPAAQPAQPRPHISHPTFSPPLVKLPVLLTQRSIPTPVAMAAEPEAAPSSGCDLTDVVQGALRDSPTAQAAIADLPIKDRSVANAVMIWDGKWLVATSSAQHNALAEVRRIVSDTVVAATAECRSQLQAGPRFVVIPGHPDTTLALGSGRWRWGSLATTEIAETEASPTAPSAATN